MIFGLIKVFTHVRRAVRIMAVKNGGAAKSHSMIGMCIATSRDMMPRVNELKVFVVRCSKKSNRRGILHFTILIDLNLFVDRFLVLNAVK